MKEKYVIYMKNGVKIETKSKEKFDGLAALLTRDNPPAFVSIENNILSVSSISHCVIEEDKSW